MDIPEEYYQKYPELENDFIQITSIVKALKLCRVEIVHPKLENNLIMPPQTFNFHIYIQIVLNRVIDLIESAIYCFINSNIASAFILLRALNENVSSIFLTSIRLDEYIKNDDFKNIHKLILKLLYGTRSKERIKYRIDNIIEKDKDKTFTRKELKEILYAEQILDVIDVLDEIIPNHRNIYDQLCEYAHPNYDGLTGLYCEWQEDIAVRISKPDKFDKKFVYLITKSLLTFSNMFMNGYDKIIISMPEFNKLTVNEIKKIGGDISSYPQE